MAFKPPSLASPGARLTDSCQLTMLQGYFERDMLNTKVFELFARKLPGSRNF